MKSREESFDEPEEQPAADYSPKIDGETDWSDRDFGIDEEIDPADRRRDPLRR